MFNCNKVHETRMHKMHHLGTFRVTSVMQWNWIQTLKDRYKPALPSIFQKEDVVVVSSNEEVKMPMIHSAASNFLIPCYYVSSGDGTAKSEVQDFIQYEN